MQYMQHGHSQTSILFKGQIRGASSSHRFYSTRHCRIANLFLCASSSVFFFFLHIFHLQYLLYVQLQRLTFINQQKEELAKISILFFSYFVCLLNISICLSMCVVRCCVFACKRQVCAFHQRPDIELLLLIFFRDNE